MQLHFSLTCFCVWSRFPPCQTQLFPLSVLERNWINFTFAAVFHLVGDPSNSACATLFKVQTIPHLITTTTGFARSILLILFTLRGLPKRTNLLFLVHALRGGRHAFFDGWCPVWALAILGMSTHFVVSEVRYKRSLGLFDAALPVLIQFCFSNPIRLHTYPVYSSKKILFYRGETLLIASTFANTKTKTHICTPM